MLIWRNEDGSFETEDGEELSREKLLRRIRRGEEITVKDRDSEDDVTAQVIQEAIRSTSTRSELVDWLGDGLRSLTSRFGDSVDEVEKEISGWIDELVEAGKITPEEAGEWLEEYTDRAKDTGGKIETKIREVLGNQVERMGLARSQDIEQLREEIEQLRDELSDDN